MGGLRKRRDTSNTKESVFIQTIELGRAVDNGDFVRVRRREDEGNIHGEVDESGVVDDGVVDMEALQCSRIEYESGLRRLHDKEEEESNADEDEEEEETLNKKLNPPVLNGLNGLMESENLVSRS